MVFPPPMLYTVVFTGVGYVFPEPSSRNTELSETAWEVLTVIVKEIPSMDCTWEGKFNVQFNILKLSLFVNVGKLLQVADQQGAEKENEPQVYNIN